MFWAVLVIAVVNTALLVNAIRLWITRPRYEHELTHRRG